MSIQSSSTPLVLLTATFPYGHGEEFLESELPFLAAAFKEVLIVPSTTSAVARPIPANAQVLPFLAEARASRSKRISALVRTFKDTRTYSELLRKARSPSAIAAVLLEMMRAKLAEAAIAAVQTAIGKDTQPLYYAYWLDSTATGLSLLSQSSNIKSVSRAHRFDLYEHQARTGFHPFRRIGLKALGQVYCVSVDGRNHLVRLHPELAKDIQVARLGVPDPKFTAVPSRTGAVSILSCSSISRVKRVGLLW